MNKNFWSLIEKARFHVGSDYLFYISLIIYLYRTKLFNIDFGDLEYEWDNISDNIDCLKYSLEEFLNSEKLNLDDPDHYLLKEVLSDASDVLFFFETPACAMNGSFVSLIKGLISDFELDDYKFYCIGYLNNYERKDFVNTNDTVCQLAAKILNSTENDRVADFCCGQGIFLSNVEKAKERIGYDDFVQSIKFAFIWSILTNKKCSFKVQDVLTLKNEKFDKIFCDYPWGLIYKKPLESLNCDKWKPLPITDIKRSMTSWLFISKVLSCLKDDGIAVVHVNNGSLISGYEKDIRETAVKKGFVKAVISLPDKLNTYTKTMSSLLVLSNGNTKIKFIDARNYGEYIIKNKIKVFNDSEIDAITKVVSTSDDLENTKTVPIEDIKNGYLDVQFYVNPSNPTIQINNGKKVSEFTSKIIRGFAINSAFLTENPESGIKVICSSDIKNGEFDINKLKYLSIEYVREFLPKDWEEQCVRSNDVIMTNKSTVIKAAICKQNDEKIILFGSLYGLRLNPEIMNPSYLCSFINSNAGQMHLRTIQTGTIISMITLANLKDLLVPCPSLTKQEKLVFDNDITLDMIKDLELRISELQKKYEGSFDTLISEEE